MAAIRAVAFDVFGTLLDTVSATRRHAERLNDKWEAFSTTWRQKQLEYTWVRTLMGAAQHVDFITLVDESLAYAAALHGVTDDALLGELRDSFDRLDVFPDVRPALQSLRERTHCVTAILSNGTPLMLKHQINNSSIGTYLDFFLSVETVGVYKPDPRVYQLALAAFERPAHEIAFVSSNPWDVFGARAFGFHAIRLNRAGAPDEYGLRGKVPEIAGLAELSALLD